MVASAGGEGGEGGRPGEGRGAGEAAVLVGHGTDGRGRGAAGDDGVAAGAVTMATGPLHIILLEDACSSPATVVSFPPRGGDAREGRWRRLGPCPG